MPKNGFHVTSNDGAREIADDIRSKIKAVTGHDIGPYGPDIRTINEIVETIFWWPARGRLFVLINGALKEVSKTEVGLLLRKTFAPIVDPDAMRLAVGLCGDNEKKQKECEAAPAQAVLNYAICRRQVSHIRWSVDMFGTQDHVEINGSEARIILRHRPFDEGDGYDDAIVDDYREHFSRFDEFLDFLVAARFASCRKTAYLWIYADSNWGKGLLLDCIIGGLRDGVTVGLSATEIEAIFEGKPSAKMPENFTHSLALVVNEFKAVKAELKQIENSISIAPKYQMASDVPVYAKIFLSAESVESLVTQNGVEDQFANRINLFEERGTIEDRETFRSIGKARYGQNLRNYAATQINRKIAELQGKGYIAASEWADRWLASFFSKYGIGGKHAKFSETLQQVAQDCIDWLIEKWAAGQTNLDGVKVLEAEGGTYYLRNPSKHIDAFLEAHYPRGEVQAYRRRRTEIAKNMSDDGTGLGAYWVGKRTIKAIKLR